MITTGHLGGSLYYIALTATGDVAAAWYWRNAPERVRKIFRNRPDFWAVAPYCIAKQYIR